MNAGDKIYFTYKGGRRVGGLVTNIMISTYSKMTTIIVKLETDYIGKNDEWYEGEQKAFNLSEMKHIKIQKP